MLQKAVQVWKLNPKGPDEIRLIEQEPAFHRVTSCTSGISRFNLDAKGNLVNKP